MDINKLKRKFINKGVNAGKENILTRASKVLKIEPQSVGRFLRKYPFEIMEP